MPPKQLSLQIEQIKHSGGNTREKLASILSGDLDFHDQYSGYSAHNFHSFPAKFPPQLPRILIAALTKPGDIVLDPMCGSGTTALEAFLSGRRGLALDIDPLALMITQVKATPLDRKVVARQGAAILENAKRALVENPEQIAARLNSRWDAETRKFVDYWFTPETQLALQALLCEIERLDDAQIRLFFTLALSAIIITKTGGVSLALDLGHTRPHRAKFVISKTGNIVLGEDAHQNSDRRRKNQTKHLRSVFDEFEKRFQNNLKGLITHGGSGLRPIIIEGNAQRLPIETNTIDLIVTSPPYASNAIDYMRAHKFSLVWLGHRIGE